MSDISNQILDAVELLVDKKVSSAKYDKTIQATIISCVDEQTGKYKIKYQGNIFIAYSSDVSKTFSNGASVYVVVPENDFSKTKTIIGSVANKGQISSSIITEDQRYEEIGIDCIIDNTDYQPIELTSNSLMLYQNTNPVIKDKSLKDVLQEEFQLNINTGKAFLLRATFNTEIENALTDKEYGLKVTCKVKNSNTTVSYLLSSKYMYGNPLMYSVPVTQTRYFILDEELESIQFIELYSKGLEDKDKIFIRNLELIPCRYLTNNEVTTRHLVIKRPFGTQFSIGKDCLRAKAELYENGKIVTLDTANVTYQWYIEKPDVVEENIPENTYAGTGWEFLGTTAGTQPYFDYIKDFFPQQSRQIKCVLCYTLQDEKSNNAITTYSAISEFNNSDTKYANDYFYIEKSLTKDNGWELATEHLFSSGGEDIYIRAKIKDASNYSVHWIYQDTQGIYKFHNSEDKSQNPIYIQSVLLNGSNREYIACYYNNEGIFIGQEKFKIGYKSEDSLDYDVTVLNGNRTFIYNEYGLAPTVTAQTEKVVIDEITLNMIDKNNPTSIITAQQITESGNDKITWYITANERDRLIDFTDTVKNGGVEQIENIGGVDYVYAQGPTLSYTLQEKYKTDANSNIIKIKISYGNDTIWATAAIQCYKVGDPGIVNGNLYIDIVEVDQSQREYNELKYINYFRYTLNQENSFVASPLYFKAKIWNGAKWLDNGEYTVSWKILNELPKQYFSDSPITLNTLVQNISTSSNICTITPRQIQNGASGKINEKNIPYPLAQLLQAKITINVNGKEKIYYRIIPIAAIFQISNTTQTQPIIVDNSGFKYIKFDSAGYNPIYDANRPFEIAMQDNKGNIFDNKNNTFSFNWNCINNVYNILNLENDVTTTIDLLRFNNNSQQQFTVSVNSNINISEYLCYYIGVTCKIKYLNTIIGYIYIPINVYKSNLDNAIVNGWDGTLLDMGTDDTGSSYLMSNMIGAGSKNENDKFSGVLLGEIVSTHKDPSSKTTSEQGIMAYSNGERTFFLNAEDGSAVFGSTESGAITIQPASIDKNGNVKHSDAKISGGGMTINVSKDNSSIEFHNGNFSVDPSGHLQAKGADIQGSFSAGEMQRDYDNILVGTKVEIGLDADTESFYPETIFDLTSVKRDGNTLDKASIHTEGFGFCKKTYKDGEWKLTSGIEYEDGKLTIAGDLQATTGTIGGWRITEDSIVSATNDLVLYSNGRIVGLGISDDDDEFIDVGNKTISWKQINSDYSSNMKDWQSSWDRDKNNNTVNASISSTGGSLTVNADKTVSIASQDGASMTCGNASMGLLNDTEKNLYGISVSALNTSSEIKGQSVAVNIGGQVLKTLNNELPDHAKFNGFAVFNSTYNEGEDGNKVWVLKRQTKSKKSQNQVEQYISLKPKEGDPTKLVTVPTTLEEAITYWHTSGRNAKYYADAFNQTSKSWNYFTAPYLISTTYSVVGLPPISASMSKDGKNYIIKEVYPEGVLLNVPNNTLTYTIVMGGSDGKQVQSIRFPNGQSMTLKGFNAILNVDCPYKK